MKKSTKIWIGVGAFVIAGAPAAQTVLAGSTSIPPSGFTQKSDGSMSTMRMRLAQHAGHGATAQQSGEGEGGEAGGEGGANLPPDQLFTLRIAQIRGHLFVGNELVKGKQWDAALPHFLHPSEEIYAGIKDQLKDYNTPEFEEALTALADSVKDKKGGAAYTKAWKTVNDSLVAAEASIKAKQKDFAPFTMTVVLALVKSALGEYGNAIEDGKFTKPVEYQDARGFIFHGEDMLKVVAADLKKKDAKAFGNVQKAIRELKSAFPGPTPPKKPKLDLAKFSIAASRLELAASPLQ
ncbi:hypothetical protein GJW-30_1_03724 [Variibacter gotjawalensis]|uniref:Uncharacterized protein n=1 Tax=Variibacter gotjawalensis TaxID=1333996 RepID=A0A0S3PZ09_9BRAD|nr:hypothetical protein [Variibacter gotjawalensis]NIK47004.1 hypothetical protein [Variibacter gotjawalensis]RZS48908.1 hypothetical protein EV661_1331 [Variibacter gotjawalensis]BAT61167.1 hypothetical protein GJW-30_1_03724 [Variibacter gotjawalensis]